MKLKKGQFVKGFFSGNFYEIIDDEDHGSLISTKHLFTEHAGKITLNAPRDLIPLTAIELHELKLTLSGNQL